MIDDMKLLKIFEYKNHNIKIYGKYKESEYDYVMFEGKKYSGIVETAYVIHNASGKQVSKKLYVKSGYESFGVYNLEHMDFIASNTVIKEGTFFKKNKKHITLKENLENIIQKLEKHCIEVIEDKLEQEEQKEREKIITDGLMDSLDKLQNGVDIMHNEELKERFLFKLNENSFGVDDTIYLAVLIKNVPKMEDFYQVFWREEAGFFTRRSTDYNVKMVQDNIKEGTWIIITQEEE
jgi:hypothetical protein